MYSECWSVDYCRKKAEVFCECKTPEKFFCGEHGYEHYRKFGHDLKEINKRPPTLNFLDLDFALLTGGVIKYSDLTEGPSGFQKKLLKYLKAKPVQDLEKLELSDNLKHYLFEVTYKIPCFRCKKAVSCIKVHLFSKHKMDENSRKEYWNQYQESYSKMGLVFTDLV